MQCPVLLLCDAIHHTSQLDHDKSTNGDSATKMTQAIDSEIKIAPRVQVCTTTIDGVIPGGEVGSIRDPWLRPLMFRYTDLPRIKSYGLTSPANR